MSRGQKHLVQCRCILPQFRNASEPTFHRFAVFSIINDDEQVVPKIVQCNNCGILHKVTDICTSQIMNGKEGSPALPTIDDIKSSLPPTLVALLETHDADLATWESAKFIVDNKRWGEHVVLTADLVDDLRQGKYVRILGENLHKVEVFSRTEFITV